ERSGRRIRGWADSGRRGDQAPSTQVPGTRYQKIRKARATTSLGPLFRFIWHLASGTWHVAPGTRQKTVALKGSCSTPNPIVPGGSCSPSPALDHSTTYTDRRARTRSAV